MTHLTLEQKCQYLAIMLIVMAKIKVIDNEMDNSDDNPRERIIELTDSDKELDSSTVPEVEKTSSDDVDSEVAEDPGVPENELDEKLEKIIDEEIDEPEETKLSESVEQEPSEDESKEKQDDKEVVNPDESLSAEEKKHHRFRRWFKAKWQSKFFRFKFFVGLIALTLIILLVVPVTRYMILNSVGLRTRVSFVIRDAKTKLPLAGVDVKLAGVSGETNSEGRFIKDRILHGQTDLIIEQPGFAKINREVTLGFGPNVFEDINLETSGSRFSLQIIDRFSDKPISNANVSFEDSSAVSDEKGVAELVIEPTSEKTIEVSVVGNDHSERKYKIKTTADKQTLKLIPKRKHYFISQRNNGDFGVYSIDLDGQNETQLIDPTGDEEADINISISPDGATAALSSTRAGKRNSDGYLLHNLDIINLENQDIHTIATAENIDVIGWWEGRLIFSSVVAGSSIGNSSRTRIRSYDVENDQTKEIAKSNYFQDIILNDGNVYYVPFDFTSSSVSGIRTVSVDGSNDRSIINSNSIYTLYRNRFGGIVYEVAEKSKWYSFDFNSRTQTTLPGKPANLLEINYSLSPDKKQAVYVEKRDGKGTLIINDIETGEDSVVLAKSGLKDPLQWLRGDLLVYRVDTRDETSDYLYNFNTKESTKIVDVFHSNASDDF